MIVVLEDVGLSHGEVPIENIEEFAFDAADVSSAEYPGTQGPVVILDRPIIDILWIPSMLNPLSMYRAGGEINTDFISEYERPKKDALAGPLGRLDKEVLLCSLDVYQRDQYRGDLDLGAVNHV